MSIFSKAKISTALDKRRPHNFSSRHITTADFFQLIPIYHREMVPKSSINIDVRSFARLKDMPVPTFGQAKMNLRAFFVPMRTIYRGWDDFITDTVHVTSGNNTASHDEYVPYVRNDQILDLFRKEDIASTVSSADAADITIYQEGTNPSVVYKVLTPFGRQVHKILECLGYRFSTFSNRQDRYSALPLLSFLRAYLDWYYPSQYYGDASSALLMSMCVRDTSQDPSFSSDRLLSIFKVVSYVAYGDDYFTSAFDSPNGPTPFQGIGASSINIDDINKLPALESGSNPYGVRNSPIADVSYYANTPRIESPLTTDDTTEFPTFTQYIIDSLKALTDFMKRHQLVGARAFERYAARFNVELPASKLNRSIYLGSHQCDLMVSDVMSTADTDGANLGSYAGKGIIAGKDGKFDYRTDEYGYFIICASIVPDIGYCQGNDRKTRHLTKLDFFSPEFDSLGTQAVIKEELFVPQHGTAGQLEGYKDVNSGVFGFMPRYAEYKVPRNNLTGDFKLNTQSVGDTSPSWHFFRLFKSWSFPYKAEDIVHSRSFVRPFEFVPTGSSETNQLYGDGLQYDRIFYNTDLTEDHFVCLFFFNEKHLLPMKPLWDTYDFKDEDEHSQRVVDVNGLKMN